jgi:hypothetical protein
VTEAEWLACADPVPMLGFLLDQASQRKRRLFGCACCRRMWRRLGDERSRSAVSVAERYADREATRDELNAAWAGACEAARDALAAVTRAWFLTRTKMSNLLVAYAATEAAEDWVTLGGDKRVAETPTVVTATGGATAGAGKAEQAAILRDIFGNPSRPSPPLSPAVLAWNDRTVPRLAQAAYDERRLPEGTLDPGRLGILADALLDAGCADEGLLAHLRSPGPHVRGCWAVDLILGKS